MNYFLSDTHFGHQNVIKYDNRPFESVEEMDAIIIRNWNKAVKTKDTVYILGDFSWYNVEKTCSILDALNGVKILIKGNHDNKIPDELKSRFEKVCTYLELKENGRRIILSHYPILFWNGQHKNSILLYGHVHNTNEWRYCNIIYKNLEKANVSTRAYNVGCMMDYMGYTPRTLDWIINSNS